MIRKCTICLRPLRVLSFQRMLLYEPIFINTIKHTITSISHTNDTYIDVSISFKQNSIIRLRWIYKICEYYR